MLDFYYEKGKQYEQMSAVGRCPICHKAFRSKHVQEEQMMAFKFSTLEPISEGIYRALKRSGAPDILVTSGEPSEENTELTPQSAETSV